MKIGIIGTGGIGGALARQFVSAGHEVSIANSLGVEAVSLFAATIGARPASVPEAAEPGGGGDRGAVEQGACCSNSPAGRYPAST